VTEGKVNLNELRKDVFKEVTYSDTEGKEATLYTAIVWATSLKRKVQVVIVDCQDPNKKTQTRKTFFSTDLDMSAKDIMDTYKTRFQIEFLLRDAKQFTGLTHCQSRNEKSLDFAFNMSLSTINAVRAYAKENNINLSVANIKTLMHNNMMINQILCKSGCRPDRLLNAKNYRELLFYGVFESA
jgi:IS4 transposase